MKRLIADEVVSVRVLNMLTGIKPFKQFYCPKIIS